MAELPGSYLINFCNGYKTLTLTFISEQKLKYSIIVYIKITRLNRIYNNLDNN